MRAHKEIQIFNCNIVQRLLQFDRKSGKVFSVTSDIYIHINILVCTENFDQFKTF